MGLRCIFVAALILAITNIAEAQSILRNTPSQAQRICEANGSTWLALAPEHYTCRGVTPSVIRNGGTLKFENQFWFNGESLIRSRMMLTSVNQGPAEMRRVATSLLNDVRSLLGRDSPQGDLRLGRQYPFTYRDVLYLVGVSLTGVGTVCLEYTMAAPDRSLILNP